MAGCPRCGKHWPDDYQRCPEDGTALRASAVGMTSATSGGAVPALSPHSDEDLPAGSIAGEYKIEKKIGEGGMGSVYGARHPVIGKRAAIKVIRRELSTSQEAVDRFVLEAQSVNQIGHPNIVDVFGFGQLSDGRSFFVMEWLEGESLRDRLQRPLAFPEALEILEYIAKALQAAHDAGVVHRDLKPDNVYLHARKGEKPSVKLLDFGLAKLTGGTSDSPKFDRTRTGMVMGTPLYLSPEQAKGTKIDAATDVYSLGAMAYEMFSGAVPFKADSAVEIMAMHISSPAVPLNTLAPWVPPDVNRLVLSMLEKDPRSRPTTAQVREAFATIRASASAASMQTTAMSPAGGPNAWTPQHGGTPHPTPYQRPVTPVSGVPYAQQVTPSSPWGVQTPSSPQQSPYGQQPTPSTPQVSPYATPSSTISPSGGGKRGLVIGGVVVAVLAIGAVVFFVAGKKDKRQAEQQPVAVVETKPDETKPIETKPAETTPVETKPVETKPDETKPVETKPDETKPDETKPDEIEQVTVAKPDPAKAMGRVNITIAGPPKALVLIDGKAMGREASGKASFALAPGDHTIRVQARGFKPTEQKIRIRAGGTETVKLTLQKARTVNSVEDPFAD